MESIPCERINSSDKIRHRIHDQNESDMTYASLRCETNSSHELQKQEEPPDLPLTYSPLINAQSYDYENTTLQSLLETRKSTPNHLKKCDKKQSWLSHTTFPDLNTVALTLVLMLLCSGPVVQFAGASLPHPIVRPQGPKGVVVPDLCEQLDIRCEHGVCVNGTQPRCECYQGWQGSACDTCGGRRKLTDLSGHIADGSGNYTTNTKCTWLLEAPATGVTMRLRFLHFATECSWDHLYIYDGNSVFSPQVAAYSGLVIPSGAHVDMMPEVVMTSGYAYLHFYSDAAYNMSGFNISYVMGQSCPLNCSGNGVCRPVTGQCECTQHWTGAGCDVEVCPGNCSHPRGTCDTVAKLCRCVDGRGPDCSLPLTQGEWRLLDPPSSPSPRASHKHVVSGNQMYVFYGYDFNRNPTDHIVKFDFDQHTWDTVTVSLEGNSTLPRPRYGHSVALYKTKVYMFGGLVTTTNVITAELWEFDLSAGRWDEWTIRDNVQVYAVVGHMAHVVGDTMHVLFGHNPVLGYLNSVQEFNIKSREWFVPPTSGAIVKGGYGQTSVYDDARGLIYVHAGYVSTSHSTYALTDELYAYDPGQRTWSILKSSGQPKFLHSASLVNGMMYVFGGNTHNDTSVSQGAKCYSTTFMAYDLECNEWLYLDPPVLHRDVARFGHVTQTYGDKMYMFGGFDGQVLADVHQYTPGDCSSFPDRPSCLGNANGVVCAWSDINAQCAPSSDGLTPDYETKTCPDTSPDDSRMYCKRFGTCQSCTTSDFYDCVWCNQKCVYADDHEPECADSPKATVRDSDHCLANHSSTNAHCDALHNCEACALDAQCGWSSNKTPKCSGISTKEEAACARSCSHYTTCDNCTHERCMWCGSEQRCVESISYVSSFPYGQCMEWTTERGRCPDTRCSGLRTCEACQNSPACGWCDDGSDTGLGRCVQGSLDAPVSTEQCPGERWHFETCPGCQCNGHSQCYNDTDTCMVCEDDTTGDHCEMCRAGYYGTATNGGNCTMCECNGQADMCDSVTGKCFCNTRGVKGDHCDVCDTENKYYGDPKNGGTCYYALNTNYRFTFNLSEDKDDSRYQTHINFMNEPPESDRDVDFSINCSSDKALMNITIKTDESEEEIVLYSDIGCQMFEEKFPHHKYPLGSSTNTTFYVYVYNFKTPFVVEISFLQIDPIDLIHFFITFFSCFLSLLLIAAVVWKVKQKCDLYRRRQRMVVEMEQMASRPFAACNVDVPRALDEPLLRQEAALAAAQATTGSGRSSQRWKKAAVARYSPSPIALEPMAGNKAAVLSLLVRLPTGDEEYTPPGQQGVALGSAVVTIGNHRKNSSSDPSQQRLDKGFKHRKQASLDTPENCV